MRKIFILGIIVSGLVTISSIASAWQNICPSNDIYYCDSVGKDAYNSNVTGILRGIRVGKIIGVSWRPKGSLIGISEAIPSAGIPESIRKSPRNAYYYIINDGDGKSFLRECVEIDGR